MHEPSLPVGDDVVAFGYALSPLLIASAASEIVLSSGVVVGPQLGPWAYVSLCLKTRKTTKIAYI